MNELTWNELMILVPFFLFCALFVFGALHSMFHTSHEPTHKEMMDWDFRGCEQMREAGWPEEEIAELMRRKGNYYDKDYE